MTREEAINTLSNFKRYISGGGAIDKKANEAIDMAIEALQGKSINCNYTCSDCVHQNKSYEEEPCHSCFNNDGAGYEPTGYEPVMHGEWVHEGVDYMTRQECWSRLPCFCSECKQETRAYFHNYCPNCGAKMDG